MISFFELFLIACLILLVNVVGFYLFRKKWLKRLDDHKKSTHRELSKELTSDFHDEVGSHLAKILSIAGILRLKTTTDQQGAYLDKIIESSKALFSGFGTLVWAIQSERTKCRDIYLEISDFGNKLFDASSTEFNCRIDEEGALRYMYYKSVKDVMLSIKEIVTNAMKHSQAQHINVDFGIDQDILNVKITDDGLGFSVDRAKLSGGLINLKKRSERSNFSYTMDSSNGSTFSLSIPIEHV
ncbi:MAG: hypothetical protein RIF33_15555 [Cyclobacteriaceae bacterium]